MKKLAVISLALATATGQRAGNKQTEVHPKLAWSRCSSPEACERVQGEVVLDSKWRWVHEEGGYGDCYTGNKWNNTICATAKGCSKNCVVEGVDYKVAHGVTTGDDSLTMKYKTEHQFGTSIGSRLFLMENSQKYQMFTLLNNELAFDIDISTLGCGLNGALFFVQMDEDGGIKRYPSNTAGAQYGMGYCDANCARDSRFLGGEVGGHYQSLQGQ
jgi:cellulose 1,4-beta-cellobiosidase